MCALNSRVHNLKSELDCTFVSLLKQICYRLRVRSRNQDNEVKGICVFQQIRSVWVSLHKILVKFSLLIWNRIQCATLNFSLFSILDYAYLVVSYWNPIWNRDIWFVFDDKHHGIGIVPLYIVLLETGFVFF